MNLAKLLQQVSLDPSPEDLADIIWLTRYAGWTETPQRNKPSPTSEELRLVEQASSPHGIEQPAVIDPSWTEPELLLHAHHHTLDTSVATEDSSLLLQVPSAPSLPHKLNLGRALRPLMRHVPSNAQLVLNERNTVQHIAETDIWTPIMESASARWLDVALVIDQAPSMAVWQQTVVELRLLLERHGAFRDVRVWRIDTDRGNGNIGLYPGTGPSVPEERPRSINELIDPTGRRLICLVSDCVADSWKDGSIRSALETWGRRNLVTVIQVLPEAFWERTALGLLSPSLLFGSLSSLSNTLLKAESFPSLFEDVPENPLWVPVVTLEAHSMASWARMIAGGSHVRVPGIAYSNNLEMDHGFDHPTSSRPSLVPLTAEERVAKFRVTVSQTARRLAELLSAAPLSLPVMRLVQTTMLPESEQTHLAEVLLGGLVRRVSDEESKTSVDSVQFEFIDGVRELLLSSLSATESKQVWRQVSEYISSRIGQPVTFQALLSDPSMHDYDVFLTKNPAFATVTTIVLRRLGRKYIDLVQRIELILQKQPAENSFDTSSNLLLATAKLLPDVAQVTSTGDKQSLITAREALLARYGRQMTEDEIQDLIDTIRPYVDRSKLPRTEAVLKISAHYIKHGQFVRQLLTDPANDGWEGILAQVFSYAMAHPYYPAADQASSWPDLDAYEDIRRNLSTYNFEGPLDHWINATIVRRLTRFWRDQQALKAGGSGIRARPERAASDAQSPARQHIVIDAMPDDRLTLARLGAVQDDGLTLAQRLEAPESSIQDQVEIGELERLVSQAIAQYAANKSDPQLPQLWHALVNQGYKLREVAEKFDLTVGQVHRRYMQMREHLRADPQITEWFNR